VQAAGLNWLELIHYEESRQMRLLKIYALFTTVKGLSNRAKRRKFLDFLLPKRAKSMSAYLYARTFLRMGDYLGLTLRLTLLALLFVAFSQNLLFSFLSVTLFNYLLIFQLFALQQAHAYQPLLKIYPRAGQSPQTALRRLIFNVLAVLVGLESLALLLKETSALLSIFIFAALTLALAYLYCNYRLKLKKSP
jgi:ABC-2 type transport system permease protein